MEVIKRFSGMTVNKKGSISKEVSGGYVYMKRYNKHFIINEYTFSLKEVKMWDIIPETLKELKD